MVLGTAAVETEASLGRCKYDRYLHVSGGSVA